MIQYIQKFGQNPSFGSRDRVQKSFFWSKFDIQSAVVTLKMRSRSPKTNCFFPLSQWCFCSSLVKIHQLVQEIECRQGLFLQSLYCGDLKIRSNLQTIPTLQYMKFGQNPTFGSRDRVQTSFFLVEIGKFYSIYSVVTLKIRPRSPNSNQIFKPSQRYNIWCLARIHHLVHEIGFLVKIWKFQSAGVTLKMKSRSPKSNHFISFS